MRAPEKHKSRLTHIVDRRNQNGPELSPRPDPLTQAAQRKCGNPLPSTSNKAFTQHHVAHVPPSTWNYCTALTQLAFPCSRFWARVCLTQPLRHYAMRPQFVSVLFCFFTNDRIMCCLEVSQGAPISVLACVCAVETRCTSFYWPTWGDKPLFSRAFPFSFLLVALSLFCVIDDDVYKYIQYPRSWPCVSGSSGSVFIPESMHIYVSIQLVGLLTPYCMLNGSY